ncbi:MAG: Bor family protein [Candidatus Marinimicrobia bacterium]|nr:Bor family protein [Candidatus Neomarinimicrobiota bacterium]
MKKVVILIVVAAFLLMSCSTHVHTIGKGPQTGKTETAKQWYILFGLVPLTDVDTAAMAGGAADYEIMTQQAPIDIVISMVLGLTTISSRSVTVKT